MNARTVDPATLAPPEERVLAFGRAVAAHLHTERLLSSGGLSALAVDRVAADPSLRAALFRLVDVSPMCHSADDLSEHLASLLGEIDEPSRLVRLVKAVAERRIVAAPVGLVTRVGVRRIASRFIAGADVESSIERFQGMWARGIGTTVDLLGEATVAEAEADAYIDSCERTLRALGRSAETWTSQPHLEVDRHGQVPRVNLSIKVSAMTPNARSDAPGRGVNGAAERLRHLLGVARDLGAHLHIDMESLDLRETVTRLVFELLAEPEFRNGPSTGMVLQGYLQDSPEELERWLEWADSAGRATPLTIRLVKGAYWDHEMVESGQAGWAVPVFTERRDCDRNFETLTRRLIERRDLVRPVIASHNLRSIAYALAAAESLADGVHAIEIQVLRGLGNDIQDALAAMRMRVRTYSPVGDLIAGMAYLVRRLLENTSNDSFLRARAETSDLNSLLVAP